jgi:chromosome segregation ATPase
MHALCTQTERSDSSKGVRDLKTLSGGERSFVTICFLLALGKSLHVRPCLFALPAC